ncbi:MAG TPA: hypothetical protein VEI83_14630 [Acidimicrobiales bacterium]|nr:hypothetical protein [Acidimicrobiales bacterium]
MDDDTTNTAHAGADRGQSSPDARSGTMNRRQAVQRIGTRAVAASVAAWVVPEILVGTPTAAGALSGGGGGGGGGSGGGGGGGSGGGGGATTASGGGSTTGATVKTAAATTPSTGPQLAYTGANVQRDVDVATGLVVGGWLLRRWGKAIEARRPDPADGVGPFTD